MSIELLDNPVDIGTKDIDLLGGDDSFPDAVIMIDLGGGRFGAVNATTTGPDPMTVGMLAVFATEKEAEIWEGIYFTGNKVNKTFQEAREIAVSKPNIYGLALQRNGNTAAIHWVR